MTGFCLLQLEAESLRSEHQQGWILVRSLFQVGGGLVGIISSKGAETSQLSCNSENDINSLPEVAALIEKEQGLTEFS